MQTGPIEEAMREYWGERCPDVDPLHLCPCCLAWDQFDQLRQYAEQRQQQLSTGGTLLHENTTTQQSSEGNTQ